MTLRPANEHRSKSELRGGYDRTVGPEDELDDFEVEHQGLVHRLRTMNWPQFAPDERKRCWRAFQRRMAGDPAGATEDESARSK
jgi:hypothetical protein